jgi:hypothetical protein
MAEAGTPPSAAASTGRQRRERGADIEGPLVESQKPLVRVPGVMIGSFYYWHSEGLSIGKTGREA